MYTRDNSHVIIVLDDSNYDKDGCCCSKNRIIFLRIHTTYLATFCTKMYAMQYVLFDSTQ